VTTGIRILHLEDDDLDAELIRDSLRSAGLECDVQCVGGRDDFERALERGDYDLILSDYTLPAFDGLSALTIASEKRPETPFIFVSGTMGEDAAVESLVSGATDYVLKSKRARLVPAVRRALLESENRRARRRAEDALRSSEARFRGLFEAASDGILILDGGATTIIDANHVAAAMLRRPRRDLVGARVSNVLLKQAGEGWREAFHELRGRGRVHLEDLRVETGDGRFARVELVSRIYQLDGDEVIQVTIRDTTARRVAEEALRQERDLVAAIAETIPVGILRADSEGRIVFANTEAEKILGTPRAQIRACAAAAWGMADHAGNPIPEEEHPFARVIRSGLPASASCSVERPDGRCVLLSVKGAPLRDASGRVEGVVLALEDVTERKAMESQFLQAQKLEAVGRLAGGVAHDFNNLLTAILSCADMLLDRMPPGDPGREDVGEIQTAARRAAALARQLLTFSRRQVIQPRVLDLNEVVTGMDRMLRRLIGEDVALVALCGPELGRVKADPGQIEQVIVNLAVNARDAMPDGGRLTIETANVEVGEGVATGRAGVSAGAYVMLAVKDTGHGMDAETQSHLFEPFFTTKETGKGTGLGLCTVYGIVKQAGGDIRVHSEPERGSTFEIYFPRTDQAPEWEYSGRMVPAGGGTETILLVEDEPQVRTLTARTLRAAGYVVLEASDGDEALRVAAAVGSIDVLVTDMVMPRVGGEAVAHQLGAQRPGMKVLIVSGYPERGMVYRHPGQDWRFLQKPYAPDALARELRRLIDAPAPGGDAARSDLEVEAPR
jgi:two-component system cell cycle sensor histidine kinase/response regulator CckA